MKTLVGIAQRGWSGQICDMSHFWVSFLSFFLRYIPVLMHQARILWDRGDYHEVEYLFGRTVDYCSDNDTWKLNVAHVLYMQGDKYPDAARFYEPIVKSNYDSVCNSASAFHSLCTYDISTYDIKRVSMKIRRLKSSYLYLVFCQWHQVRQLLPGAQPRLKSWGKPRFGPQHRGDCAPCLVKGRAGCWVRKGVAPSRCEGPRVLPPENFLELRC